MVVSVGVLGLFAEKSTVPVDLKSLQLQGLFKFVPVWLVWLFWDESSRAFDTIRCENRFGSASDISDEQLCSW